MDDGQTCRYFNVDLDLWNAFQFDVKDPSCASWFLMAQRNLYHGNDVIGGNEQRQDA